MVRGVSEASRIFGVCKRTVFNKLSQEELAEKLEEIKSFDISRAIGFDFSDLDFCGVNLNGITFKQCVLHKSTFNGASLSNTSFINCFVINSSFRGAYMSRATIMNSAFESCDFSGAYMSNVSINSSNFDGSAFDGAVLIPSVVSTDTGFFATKINNVDYIDFRKLSCAENVPYFPLVCPDNGAFIGWKKCRYDKVVKLLIPEDAKRSSAMGRKCRCNKAVVLEIQDTAGNKLSDLEVAYSKFDIDFVYRVGETVTVDYFCEDRWNECAPGIHFFINRQEAVEY